MFLGFPLYLDHAGLVSENRRQEKNQKKAAYVVVSNHQSLLDILVVYRLFFHFKWISKAEIFRIPLIGWNMRLNRYIELRRGRRESIRRMFADAEKALAQGSSVFFFPEGTRSETGLLGSFHSGAFILAHKMKIPILPIVIKGTQTALPKNSLNFHGKYLMNIKVLDEFPYEAFAGLSIEETTEMVRNKIAEHVETENDTPATK